MAVTMTDVLKANFVLVGFGLLNTQNELTAFQKAANADVVPAGSSVIVGPPTNAAESGRLLSINRDRITLELFPSRSVITRDYPLEQDLDRLAEVADYAVTNTGSGVQQLRAFGYNIEMVYDQDSEQTAYRYISERLFSGDILGEKGWHLAGGAATLIFEEDTKRWSIKFEPRFRDFAATKVFLGLNLHIAEQPMPSREEINSSLREAWRCAHDFVNRMDESR